MEKNAFDAEVNQQPIFVPHIDDFVRIGSFVHVELYNQEPDTTTIARIERRIQGGFHLRLYYPLFPKTKLKNSPPLPVHQERPIPFGSPGSLNIELYQAAERISIVRGEVCKILYPAFVFSEQELTISNNAWAHGIHNVFVLRFLEKRDENNFGETSFLEKLDPEEKVCFPNTNAKHIKKEHLTASSRCLHETIWCGMYLIRKAIIKLLNKRSSLSEPATTASLSIGYIPLETYNYLSLLVNDSLFSSCRIFNLSESYMDTDAKLSRKKLRFHYNAGVMRFETVQDIELLREVLGIACTYGSLEHRPRLKDGSTGVPLQSGHSLSIVRGREEQDDDTTDSDKRPFKRIFRDEGVDLCFSTLNTRVTVGYSKYHFHSHRNGNLKFPPPTAHLKNILEGKVKENYEDTLSVIQPPPPDPSAPLDIGIRIGETFEREGTIYKVIRITRLKGTDCHDISCQIIAGRDYNRDNSPKWQAVWTTCDEEELRNMIERYN